jgi:hypothetical protein
VPVAGLSVSLSRGNGGRKIADFRHNRWQASFMLVVRGWPTIWHAGQPRSFTIAKSLNG